MCDTDTVNIVKDTPDQAVNTREVIVYRNKYKDTAREIHKIDIVSHNVQVKYLQIENIDEKRHEKYKCPSSAYQQHQDYTAGGQTGSVKYIIYIKYT